MTEECPNVANHTKRPTCYGARFAWANKKLRRHYQIQCPGCGLWKIWKRRPADEMDYGDEDTARLMTE